MAACAALFALHASLHQLLLTRAIADFVSVAWVLRIEPHCRLILTMCNLTMANYGPILTKAMNTAANYIFIFVQHVRHKLQQQLNVFLIAA